MGVTFFPSSQKAESFFLSNGDSRQSTAQSTFGAASDNVHGRPQGKQPNFTLLYSSLSLQGPGNPNIVPVPNGLLHTILEAWNHHRMLVIRPDDVWIAILTQFSFFVNANAESLRGQFLPAGGDGDGQRKTLEVTIPSLDVDILAERMSQLLEQNITDPSILEWIMPDFTTTTTVDKTVGAIVMMSTFQKYFDYRGRTLCGIPAVTLEGTKGDWQGILRRIEKLKEYGFHTTAWYHVLRPVIRRFVTAFDDPSNPDNLDFWNRAIKHNRSSGGGTFSGWITAFCVFNSKGQWIGPYAGKSSNRFAERHRDLDTPDFWRKFMVPLHPSEIDSEKGSDRCLVLDGAIYRTIYADNIPSTCVGVDIKLLGGLAPSEDAGFLAGIGAYSISSSGDLDHSVTGKEDTIQPVPGWWLYLKPHRASS